MKRVVNKVLPLTGTFANMLEIQDGLQLQVVRHAYQNRTRRDFFWVTTQVGLIPSQPSQLNAAVWEQDCILELLILGARMHPLSTDTTTEPEAKQPRVLMDKSSAILGGSGAAGGGTQTSTSSSSPPSWWESGDARKIFFAPSAVNYESMQCIKSIMLDCIELQESLDFDYKSSSWWAAGFCWIYLCNSREQLQERFQQWMYCNTHHHQYNRLQFLKSTIQYLGIVRQTNTICCPISPWISLPTVGLHVENYSTMYCTTLIFSDLCNSIFCIVRLTNTIYWYCRTHQYNILLTIYCNIL